MIAKLKARGYIVFEQQIDSDRVGLPQSRQRLWFLCVRADIAAAAGVSEESVVGMMQALVQRFMLDVSHTCPSLSDFLLCEADPEIMAMRRGLIRQRTRGGLTGSRGPGGGPMEQDSVAVRRKQQRERDVGMGSLWRPELEEVYPEYLRLSEREKAMLDANGVQFPDRRNVVIGVRQNEALVKFGRTPTVTPTATIWVGERCRLLRGAESLRVQGIHIGREAERSFSNKLLADLGGNSFSTPACTMMIIIGLCVLSDLWERRSAALSTPMARRPKAPMARTVSNDEDSWLSRSKADDNREARDEDSWLSRERSRSRRRGR